MWIDNSNLLDGDTLFKKTPVGTNIKVNTLFEISFITQITYYILPTMEGLIKNNLCINYIILIILGIYI